MTGEVDCFTAEKLRSVRWLVDEMTYTDPEVSKGLAIAGTYGSQKEILCVWCCTLSTPENVEKPEPFQIASIEHKGAVIDLKVINRVGGPLIITGSTNGEVKAYTTNCRNLKQVTSVKEYDSLLPYFSLQLHYEKKYHRGSITTLATNSSGKDFASGSEDGSVAVGSLDNSSLFKPLRNYDQADSVSVNDLEFQNDTTLVSAVSSGTVKIFDLNSRSTKPQLALQKSESERGWPLSCAVHPSSTHFIAAGFTNGCVNIWDIRKSDQSLFQLLPSEKEKLGNVWQIEFHKTETDKLMTCTSDGSLLLWDFKHSASSDDWQRTFSKKNEYVELITVITSDMSINCFDINTLLNAVICAGDDHALRLQTQLL